MERCLVGLDSERGRINNWYKGCGTEWFTKQPWVPPKAGVGVVQRLWERMLYKAALGITRGTDQWMTGKNTFYFLFYFLSKSGSGLVNTWRENRKDRISP